jgi:hypothetical protein
LNELIRQFVALNELIRWFVDMSLPACPLAHPGATASAAT